MLRLAFVVTMVFALAAPAQELDPKRLAQLKGAAAIVKVPSGGPGPIPFGPMGGIGGPGFGRLNESGSAGFVVHSEGDTVYILTVASPFKAATPMGGPPMGGPPGLFGGPPGAGGLPGAGGPFGGPPGIGGPMAAPEGAASAEVDLITRAGKRWEGKADVVLVRPEEGFAILRARGVTGGTESIAVGEPANVGETAGVYTLAAHLDSDGRHDPAEAFPGFPGPGPFGIGGAAGPGGPKPAEKPERVVAFRSGMVSSVLKDSLRIELVSPPATGLTAVLDRRGQLVGVVAVERPAGNVVSVVPVAKMAPLFAGTAIPGPVETVAFRNRTASMRVPIRLFDPKGRIAKVEYLYTRVGTPGEREAKPDGTFEVIDGALRVEVKIKDGTGIAVFDLPNLAPNRADFVGQLVLTTTDGKEIVTQPKPFSPQPSRTP